MASNDLFGSTPPPQDTPGHDPYGWDAANFGRYSGSAALRSDPSAEDGTPLPPDLPGTSTDISSGKVK